VVHFHQTLKATCDRHNPQYYQVFKPWCDEYFYLKHRGETRGVGGIFFDYQDGQGLLYRGPDAGKAADQTSQTIGELPQRNWDDLFNFARDCGDAFLPAYVPIVERRHQTDYSDHQRQFQLYRRVATLSSTWCTTGAPSLVCKPTGAPSPF
jgi:coproporphyrinogen III oxidase